MVLMDLVGMDFWFSARVDGCAGDGRHRACVHVTVASASAHLWCMGVYSFANFRAMLARMSVGGCRLARVEWGGEMSVRSARDWKLLQ